MSNAHRTNGPQISQREWTARAVLANLASRRLRRPVAPAEITPDRSLNSLGLTVRGDSVIRRRMARAGLSVAGSSSKTNRWKSAGDVLQAVV